MAATIKQSIRMPPERYKGVQRVAGDGQAAAWFNAFAEAVANRDPAALELIRVWLPVVQPAAQRASASG